VTIVAEIGDYSRQCGQGFSALHRCSSTRVFSHLSTRSVYYYVGVNDDGIIDSDHLV